MKSNTWRLAPFAVGALVGFAQNSQIANAADNPPGTVVYQWTGKNLLVPSPNPWKGEAVTRPDGGTAISASGTGMGYNNYLFVPKDKFKPGHEYTAILKYEIVSPTKFPDSFYIFFRSSKLGQAEDLWRMWNGDPGDKGTAKLTLSINANKSSDDWSFYGGCKGPGTMIIDSLQIVEGTGLEYLPATAAAKPAAPSAATGAKLPTGAVPFTIEKPAVKQGLVLSAKDFGLVPDGAEPVSTEVATANFAGITAALKACKDRGASTLTFPKGTYRFYGRAGIPITDLSDLTIDGQGSTFLFTQLHTGIEAISVYRCERVVIKNLYVDWDWNVTPIASTVTVAAGSEDGKSYDFTFPDLTEKEIQDVKRAPWMSLSSIDTATLTRTFSTRAQLSVAGIDNADPKTLRVSLKTPVSLKTGETYSIRHLYYDFGAFKIGYSSNLVFDNVNIYSIPGMGFFCTGDMKNWAMINCKIDRPAGSRRPITTAADGFHVSQSQGNLLLQDCVFTGCGDDSINIHDNCFQGVQRVDDTTLTLVNCPPWRIRINEGDQLELFRGNYAPLGYNGTVKSVVFKDKNTTVTLTNPLPADLSPLSIVVNRRYNTRNVRIANCKFVNTTGRSILLSAHGATIENCLFKNAMGTAIQLHTEIVGDLWAEGTGATNVVIRGNTFENTSVEGRYDNAVVYSGAKMSVGVTSYPLFRALLIEKNRFINPSGPAVSLNSTADSMVRENRIESPRPSALANNLSGAVYAANVSNVSLSGNIWETTPAVGKTGIVVDPATTSEVVVRDNIVLKTP